MISIAIARIGQPAHSNQHSITALKLGQWQLERVACCVRGYIKIVAILAGITWISITITAENNTPIRQKQSPSTNTVAG